MAVVRPALPDVQYEVDRVTYYAETDRPSCISPILWPSSATELVIEFWVGTDGSLWVYGVNGSGEIVFSSNISGIPTGVPDTRKQTFLAAMFNCQAVLRPLNASEYELKLGATICGVIVSGPKTPDPPGPKSDVVIALALAQIAIVRLANAGARSSYRRPVGVKSMPIVQAPSDAIPHP